MTSLPGWSTRQSMYSAKISPPNTSWRVLGLVAAERVEVVAHRLALVVGNADQHAHDPRRHDRAEVDREVEAPGADQRIEQVRTHRSDCRLQPRDLAGREHPRQQAAMDRVRGRILEDQRARRELHARLEQVERHPSTRDERLPVDVRALDVVEAAQRVEVVLLVVSSPPPATDLNVGETVRVQVASSAGAPAGGLQVTLSASGTGGASFPAMVTIPAGSTATEFELSADTAGEVTLTASAPDRVSDSLTFTIRAELRIDSIHPTSGPVGSVVELVGSGFDPAPARNLVEFPTGHPQGAWWREAYLAQLRPGFRWARRRPPRADPSASPTRSAARRAHLSR